MDLIIYKEDSKDIVCIFSNAELKAGGVMISKEYILKSVLSSKKCIKENEDGSVKFDDGGKTKAKIIYLNDYREKPY